MPVLKESKKQNISSRFSWVILAAALAFLLFPNQVLAADELGSALDAAKYNKHMDVWFILFLVAFLMGFIRKFEWTTYLAVLLTTASSYLVYMFGNQFVLKMPAEEVWSQDTMISAATCAVTAVVAIGVFLGTVKMWQYLLVGVLFSPCYLLLNYLQFTWLPAIAGGEVTDPGGGILVHFFAAYWGLGVALGIREKRAFDEPAYTTKHSLSFAWLSGMFLFMLWPSFVTAIMPLENTTAVTANTYMAGLGAMITSYLINVFLSKDRKVNPLVYICGMLTGLVASSSTLLLAGPWTSLAIGALAGICCPLAINYLQGWLAEKLGVLDVMGVHSLHGIGGWISLLTGAIMAGNLINIWAALITLALGIVSGFIVGLILKASRGQMDITFEDADEFEGDNPDPVLEPAK